MLWVGGLSQNNSVSGDLRGSLNRLVAPPSPLSCKERGNRNLLPLLFVREGGWGDGLSTTPFRIDADVRHLILANENSHSILLHSQFLSAGRGKICAAYYTI